MSRPSNDLNQPISSQVWGTVAAATGMWLIASVALIGADGRAARPDGVLWTTASSDKVASHPTLVRRTLPWTPGVVRTATLETSE